MSNFSYYPSPVKIGVYTSICEEDAVYIDQYLAEIDRLGLDFAINLDRCSDATKTRLQTHPHCIGSTERNDPAREFTERDKQGIFDILEGRGYDWALAWDMDETWEKNAAAKFAALATTDADYFDCPWMNLWGDKDHLRRDGAFAGGHRVKLYRLQAGWKWRFMHAITNGAKHTVPHREPKEGKLDLVCLHWGMMTREIREHHKARWDRIYTAAVGNNPYGFWDFALDESITPVIAPNPYL